MPLPTSITKILQRTADSIGGVKQARRPSPNRVHYWPADEMNAALDGLAAISAWLGLSDGSTPNTVFQALRAMSGPRHEVFRIFDDFVLADMQNSMYPYDTAIAGAGSSLLLKAAPNEVGGGCGVVEMIAGNAASASAYFGPWSDNILRGSQLPDVRFRFKTPASFVGCDIRLGPSHDADASYARLRMTGTANASFETKSATGGGSGTLGTATVLAPSTWYELRIAIGVGRVDYYINDVLVGSETIASRIPVAGDTFMIFRAQIDRTSAGPHTMLVDWFELAARRL